MLAPIVPANAAAASTDSAIARLASGGIGVYDSYAGAAPIKALSGTPSAMRLTRWQLGNLIAQADAHMGTLGSSIDALEGKKAPKNAPTFSYFMAAWVKRGQGPLALYAQQLMGKQNWKRAPRIVFPSLVIDLFVGDAARMTAGVLKTERTNRFAWERFIAAPAQADGVCSAVSSFVSGVVSDVENALQVSGNSFFATLWNTAITLVSGLAEVVIGGVLTPLLSILNAVAGGLAAISAIASTLKPWTLTVAAQPTQITIGSQPQDGQFVATLDAQAINWPAEVSDCASALSSVDLSKISSSDAPVTWKTLGQIPGLASVTSQDPTIGSNNQATLHYRTIAKQPEESNPSCPTQTQSAGQGGVQVSVERVDVERLEQQLAQLAFSKLPSVVRSNLAPLFQAVTGSAQAQFAQLIAKAPTGSAFVSFMEAKPSKNCTPSPSPSPSTPPHNGYQASDLLGSWKCTFSTKVGPGVAFSTSTTIGSSSGYVEVAGHSMPSASSWTYNPTGPTTGAMVVTHPGSAKPETVDITWITTDHLTEHAGNYTYDCTRQ
jgi:hypothetical protein